MDSLTDKHHLEALGAQVNKKSQLEELNGNPFHNFLILLKRPIKISFTGTFSDVNRFVQFADTVDEKKKTGITEIDLSYSNFFSDSDGSNTAATKTGKMLIYLQHLITLKLKRCGFSSSGLSSVDCLARVYGYFRSFLRSQDPFPVRDPLPVG